MDGYGHGVTFEIDVNAGRVVYFDLDSDGDGREPGAGAGVDGMNYMPQDCSHFNYNNQTCDHHGDIDPNDVEMKKSNSLDSDPSSSHGNGSPVLKVNPFLQDVIIRKLISFLDFETISNCRLLCKLWNDIIRPSFQTRSVLSFQIPSHELVEDWTCHYPLDNKSQHFRFYLHCFKGEKLPFLPREELLFQNFKFVNYRYRQGRHRHPSRLHSEDLFPYPHAEVLTTLERDFSHSILSLTFMDEPRLLQDQHGQSHRRNQNPIHAAYNLFHENFNYQSEFIYPDWIDCLQNFSNLQTLELIGMRRPQTEKCMSDLCKLLETGYASTKIRKLAICPGSFLEFDLTREDHLDYIKILTSLLSLLRLEDFTLKSHLSAEELPPILKTISSTLKTLSLQRLSLIPSHIQIFQNAESSMFPLSLPHLKSLEIPNVYFYNLEEINRNLPHLTRLRLKYQPIMICTDFVANQNNNNNNGNGGVADGNIDIEVEGGADGEGAGHLNIIADCAAVRLDFSLVDDLPLKNEKLTSIEWGVDPAAEVLNNFQIDVSEVCDITLFGISKVFPHLVEIKCFISSASDMEMLWERYNQLQRIEISRDSPYKTRDENIVGCENNVRGGLVGIRTMKRLRTIKFSNDNSNLTEDCFKFGLLQLPYLRFVEIRRAPALVESELDSVKSFMERKPNLLTVQVFKD